MTETRFEALADNLRGAIRRGELVSGERLVELRIAEAHGVSQATVRDALRHLEQEGWLTSQPRRGVVVRTFTREEADEVFALTAAVESLALRSVFPNLNKTFRDALRGHVRAARRASQDNKTGVGLSMLFEMHLTLARIAATDRPMTVGVLDRLHNAAQLLEATRRARTRLPSRELDPLIAIHEHFCDKLDARDLEGAEAALKRQIALYSGMVLDALSG